jgi:hypothetical protein
MSTAVEAKYKKYLGLLCQALIECRRSSQTLNGLLKYSGDTHLVLYGPHLRTRTRTHSAFRELLHWQYVYIWGRSILGICRIQVVQAARYSVRPVFQGHDFPSDIRDDGVGEILFQRQFLPFLVRVFLESCLLARERLSPELEHEFVLYHPIVFPHHAPVIQRDCLPLTSDLIALHRHLILQYRLCEEEKLRVPQPNRPVDVVHCDIQSRGFRDVRGPLPILANQLP